MTIQKNPDPDSALSAEHWCALLGGDTDGFWHKRFLARAETHPAFMLEQCQPGDMREWLDIWMAFDASKVKTTSKKEPHYQWMLSVREPGLIPKNMIPRLVHAVLHNDQRSLRMQLANIMMNAEKFQSIPPWVVLGIARMYCSDHSIGAKAPRSLVGLLRALVVSPSAPWTEQVYALFENDTDVALFAQWMAPATTYSETVALLARVGESFPAAAYDWHLSYDEPVLSELLAFWPEDICASITSQIELGIDERTATVQAWSDHHANVAPATVSSAAMDSAGS